MQNALILFVSTYVAVFALGFQSLNVNGGHYRSAFLTSFAIGASNLLILRIVPDADWVSLAGYLVGGPFGIVSSMWVHKKLFKGQHAMQGERNVEAGIPD